MLWWPSGLRRLIASQMGSPRVGSNPARSVSFFFRKEKSLLHNFTFTLQREPYSKEEKKIICFCMFYFWLWIIVGFKCKSMLIFSSFLFSQCDSWSNWITLIQRQPNVTNNNFAVMDLPCLRKDYSQILLTTNLSDSTNVVQTEEIFLLFSTLYTIYQSMWC